ncbi:MAG: septation protein SpoVG family protein, partial [Oscillospiraceae bacterium]|nr:septation protein SpoVG family protein [Oscillospiraceae bacterium]
MYINFEKLKHSLDLRDVARFYGVESKGDIARCVSPSHADKSPSMKLYASNYHCYGCGEHGDVIGLTATLHNLDYYNAAVKLTSDFAIGAEHSGEVEIAPRHSLYDEQEARIRNTFRLLHDYRKRLDGYKEQFKPSEAGATLHPLFVEALTDIKRYEHYYLQLLDSTRDEQLAFIVNNAAMLKEVKSKLTETKEEKSMENKTYNELISAPHNAKSANLKPFTDSELLELSSIISAKIDELSKAMDNPRHSRKESDRDDVMYDNLCDSNTAIADELESRGIIKNELSELFEHISNKFHLGEMSEEWNEKYDLVGNAISEREDKLVDEYEAARERQENRTSQPRQTPPEPAAEINQNNTQEEKIMEQSTLQSNPNIKATAFPIENAGKLKANATVSLSDTVVVRNLKVVETENGLTVSMPSKKVGDVWKDTVVPASSEAAAQIKAAVLEAYEKAIEQARLGTQAPKPELDRADVQVEVWSLKDSTANNNDIATCSVKLADVFVVNDVKIREGGELGLKVQLPGEYGKDGKWYETVSVFDSVVRDTVVGAYLEREQNRENIIGNTPYAQLAENRDDIRYKSYSGELANKVVAQLNAAGVPFSG